MGTVNVNKLKGKLTELGMTVTDLAALMGYDKSALYRRIRNNGASMTIDEANSPRQDFDQVYTPDGYVDLLRTSFIQENHLMHGNKVISYIIPKAVDVDAKEDLDYIEYTLERREESLLKYLRENYRTLEEADI